MENGKLPHPEPDDDESNDVGYFTILPHSQLQLKDGKIFINFESALESIIFDSSISFSFPPFSIFHL